ncbi:cytochrome c-type biogenesis protein CcsB [Anaerohalosphaera lusitana]|uniref:Cytochrome c-type biogenesis protein CcsB n=1 Tax=Anaerohalosphaera lusitana TaxID=1936003 RepID=A0A1U9NJP7_9BACT|nr:cytochrome c biogenesis protein CcsA [Anaerohalosphaera lusitana]AQT67736.1 cytochrome c-type biogenesis protein CcsB [Anaerohalosphaera lusitana]
MQNISLIENAFLFAGAAFYLAAAVLGMVRLYKEVNMPAGLLAVLIAFGSVMLAGVLFARGFEKGQVPLVDTFEFVLALTVVFSLAEFFTPHNLRKGWFEAVLSLLLFALTVTGFSLAGPVGTLDPAVKTPWVLVHGISMLVAAAAIFFSAAMAYLLLVGRSKLKSKNPLHVIGKMPSIEKLAKLNMLGLRLCTAAMTFGIVSGIGMALSQAEAIDMTAGDWLVDGKIILIMLVWVLLIIILLMNVFAGISSRAIAYVTIGAFLLALLAIVGVAVLGGGAHDFLAYAGSFRTEGGVLCG